MYARAKTKINLGGEICAKRKKCFLPPRPPPRSSWGGQNANCKFKTFGLLNTLKVQIQSSYTLQVLLYLQTKLAEKLAS